MMFKNQKEKYGELEAAIGLSKGCAAIYDTKYDGSWKNEQKSEKNIRTLVDELGVPGEDILSAKNSTYFEFSKKIFEKMNLLKPDYMKYNLLMHRMGPSEIDSIDFNKLDKYVQTHKERIVKNDLYDIHQGYLIKSSKSGAEIRVSVDRCLFRYGNIEFEFPYDKIEKWTGISIRPVQTTEPQVPVRREVSPEFRQLANKFFNQELASHEFERFVGGLFDSFGWRTEVRGVPGPDGGVDGRIYKPIPELGKELFYIIQAKRYYSRKNVGGPTVREFLGTVKKEHADGGIIATTGNFARGVKEDFETENFKIKLYDGDDLMRMTREIIEKGYVEITPVQKQGKQKTEELFYKSMAMFYSRTVVAKQAIESDIQRESYIEDESDIKKINENLNAEEAIESLCNVLSLIADNTLQHEKLVKKNKEKIKEILAIIDTFHPKYKKEEILDYCNRIKFRVE